MAMEAALPRWLTPGVICLTPDQVKRLPPGESKMLGAAVDEMGKRSAKAQGLRSAITTWMSLASSGNRLVLSVGPSSGRGGLPTIRGLLRVGERQLYVHRDPNSNQYTQVSPTCVLDFYVHESVQRQGDGRKMFDVMLAHERVLPEKLGYDRPSSKLIAFCRRHFGLCDYMQEHNFVLFQEFWSAPAAPPERRRGSNSQQLEAYRVGGSRIARRLRDEVAAATRPQPASNGFHAAAEGPAAASPKSPGLLVQRQREMLHQPIPAPAAASPRVAARETHLSSADEPPSKLAGSFGPTSNACNSSAAKAFAQPSSVKQAQWGLMETHGHSNKLIAAHHAAGSAPAGGMKSLIGAAALTPVLDASANGRAAGQSYHEQVGAARDRYQREAQARIFRRPF